MSLEGSKTNTGTSSEDMKLFLEAGKSEWIEVKEKERLFDEALRLVSKLAENKYRTSQRGQRQKGLDKARLQELWTELDMADGAINIPSLETMTALVQDEVDFDEREAAKRVEREAASRKELETDIANGRRRLEKLLYG
jgi:hypothetical protein